MPRANVYIRNENWEQWQALPDKSDFVNAQLASSAVIGMTPKPIEGMRVRENGGMHVRETGGYLTPVISHDMGDELRKIQVAKGVEFCKHNQVIGFCKKGCK